MAKRKRKRKPKQIGRPTKLTAKSIAAIAKAYRQNKLFIDATAATGISESTLREWKAIGRKDEEAGHKTLHRQLVEALDEAESYFESDLAKIVRKECNNNPDFALKVLERLVKGRWSKPGDESAGGGVSVRVGVGLQVEMTTEARQAMLEHGRDLLERWERAAFNAQPSGICALGEPRKLEAGPALNGHQPGSNGHHRGNGAAHSDN